ncbi:unnamed protein product [Hymenolepis diminuta]|uniref:C2H2-type domain-containing protein n=1 Tax=Hymenolepis diminuta TaxID=6216 RepID=A0A0R3STS3_HYMDI|nr:unnamed protein product [Hymenolepis diminuta]
MKPFEELFCFFVEASLESIKQAVFYPTSECSVKSELNDRNLKPYKCGVCGKSFSRNNTLRDHVMAVHERLKPHKCEICGKDFCQYSTLLLHISSIHNGERPYSCGYCDKKFAAKSHINRHEAGVQRDQIRGVLPGDLKRGLHMQGAGIKRESK